MKILGIESSCDDTSVCLLEATPNGHTIIALKTASQIDIHKKYGGVVPEVAGRLHAETIVPLIEEVMGDATPDAIAVTAGPGLITGLLVGVEAARTLSFASNIPLVATNHLDGHIHSVELTKIGERSKNLIQFPALALVVSGGHTELVLLKNRGEYKLLGSTQDDAAGECFDKVAKILDFPYPGGPKISQFAATGRTDAIAFPRPMLHEPNYNFSFSGLKTAALYWLRDHTFDETISKEDFCASVEQAIVDVLVAKTLRAADEYKPKQVLLAGGVAANKKLRNTLASEFEKKQIEFLIPDLPFCMDNGAMIAVAGYYQAVKKYFTPWQNIDADPNWKVDGKNKNIE